MVAPDPAPGWRIDFAKWRGIYGSRLSSVAVNESGARQVVFVPAGVPPDCTSSATSSRAGISGREGCSRGRKSAPNSICAHFFGDS